MLCCLSYSRKFLVDVNDTVNRVTVLLISDTNPYSTICLLHAWMPLHYKSVAAETITAYRITG